MGFQAGRHPRNQYRGRDTGPPHRGSGGDPASRNGALLQLRKRHAGLQPGQHLPQPEVQSGGGGPRPDRHPQRQIRMVTHGPGEALLDFILENGLTDILISRNEFAGFQVTGTGTHSGTGTTLPPRPSSTRKYICPCCGNSVRATKAVNIACLDCNERMVLAG